MVVDAGAKYTIDPACGEMTPPPLNCSDMEEEDFKILGFITVSVGEPINTIQIKSGGRGGGG